MADIRDVAGQIKLIQSRETARDEAGEFSFIVNSETSSPIGFTEPILALNPDALFIFVDSVFARIATYDDILDVPITNPKEVGGEYRVRASVRSFQDVRKASSWGREVVNSVVSLITELRDYSAVFENITEEAILPNDYFTDLQARMDSYLGIEKELVAVELELDIAKANQIILNLVYDYSRLETEDEQGPSVTLTAVDILRTNLPKLRNSLTTINSKLTNAMGIDIDSDKSIPGSVTVLDEDIPPMLNFIKTAVLALTGSLPDLTAKFAAYETVVNASDIADPTVYIGYVDELQVLSNNIWNANVNLIVDELNAIVESVSSVLTNYRNSIITSKSGLDMMAEIVAAGDGVTVDVESAVQKLNTLSTVNNAELMRLKTQTDNDVKSKERVQSDKIEEKQVAWNNVISLYPEADPDDPYKIFTHRLFTVQT